LRAESLYSLLQMQGGINIHKFWEELIKFKLYCDRRSVGQFAVVSGQTRPDFNFLSLTITFFLPHAGCPL
jgi:hypothetical protein